MYLRHVHQSEYLRVLAKICVACVENFGERLQAPTLLNKLLYILWNIPNWNADIPGHFVRNADIPGHSVRYYWPASLVSWNCSASLRKAPDPLVQPAAQRSSSDLRQTAFQKSEKISKQPFHTILYCISIWSCILH